MTIDQWSKALAKVEDKAERRDCLLMCADDLTNEEGAALLRSLALRPEGLAPLSFVGSFDWVKEGWSVHNRVPRTHQPDIVPASLVWEDRWVGRSKKEEAWLFLLQRVEALGLTSNKKENS